LRSLGREHIPHSLSSGVPRLTPGGGGALVGKGEHDGEDGEDEGKDKKKGCGGNGSMMAVGRAFRTVWMTLSVAITMWRGRLSHPDADRVRRRQGCGGAGALGGSYV
jgi:hypothetical protein